MLANHIKVCPKYIGRMATRTKPIVIQKNRDTGHITVIDTEFYDTLVLKIGARETLDYLEKAAAGRIMDIVRVLYLDGESPKSWTIARRGARHYRYYRYLDGNREIIDDPDGRKLGKLIGNGIMQACLSALSGLITEGLMGNAPPELIEQFQHIQSFDHLRLSDLEYVLNGLDSVIPIIDDHPLFAESR